MDRVFRCKKTGGGIHKKFRAFAVASAMVLALPAYPLQAAEQVPAAYMNTFQQVTKTYPSTRDQGSYSTCWAFTAISLAEMDLITDNHAAGKGVDLSELALSYDTWHPAADPFGGTKGDGLSTTAGYLEIGGNLDYCSRVLLQWRGLIQEKKAPYASAFAYRGGKETQAAHLQNVSILDLHKNRSRVKKEIMEHGGAGISFYFSNREGFDQMASYQGEKVAVYYCNKTYEPNHAASVVGWDDDFPAAYFKNKPGKNGAWLVRNSWSDTAANSINSYFWLSYEDKSLESDAWILDFEPADNYDYIYQYDGCPAVGKVTACPVSANVFKVQGASNELLRAVSITLNEDNAVPYTIKVYSNLSNSSNPRSGILETTVSGKTTAKGTFTIPLKQPVSLKKGMKYAIVVELNKKNAGIDMEFAASDESVKSVVGIKKNQSFLYRNGAWKDVSQIVTRQKWGNLCIKGFSDKSKSSVGTVSKLKASGASARSVKLSWTKAASAQGYELYRADSKNGTYRKIATVKGKSYKNTGLKKGKTYYYKVRAYKKTNGVKITGKLSPAVKVSGKRG